MTKRNKISIKDFFVKNRKLLVVVLISIIFDQITKITVSLFKTSNLVIIKNQFNIEYFINNKFIIDFGLNIYIKKTISFALTITLIYFLFFIYKKINKNKKYLYLGFGLITGGSLSNLIDRIIFGGVIDFINIHKISTFNFADIFLITGMVLIAFEFIKNNDNYFK